MNNYVLVRIFAVIVIIVIIVAAVVQLANIGSNGDAPAAVPATEVSLEEADRQSSKLRYIIDGPINARENHRTIRITVSATERKIEILRGYSGEVIRQETYPNDADAYENFVQGLLYEGFDNTRESELGDDYTGVCPSGSRYVTELYENDELLRSLWRSTCSSSAGTLDGDSQTIRRLFIDQIPDYRDITRSVKIA